MYKLCGLVLIMLMSHKPHCWYVVNCVFVLLLYHGKISPAHALSPP